MTDTTVTTWIDIISYIDITLTIFGGWALIKTIIFLFFYFTEKDQYVECIYRHYANISVDEIQSDYPIRKIIILDESATEFFVIGFPGKVMRNIKIYEWRSMGYITNRLIYKKKENLIEQIHSDEYLLVQCNSAETIPGNKITCRVNGDLVKFHFEFNGIYGVPSKNYKKVKHDLYSFLHLYFRSTI
ncbi:hypothetical protein [Desemzia sp. FAM 23988]|uniref:hypothetical protein n=1 Tax=unclassified Desemzia TaxID=2685243 RepID=UPI003883D232